MAVDGKHYWLTPPAFVGSLRAEFGDLYDPCPYPRPEGFDGLSADWGQVTYVNPPFLASDTFTPDGKRKGITAWARKAVGEWRKGKTILFLGPRGCWMFTLLEVPHEVRVYRKWAFLATEDGSRQPCDSHPMALFILRGIGG